MNIQCLNTIAAAQRSSTDAQVADRGWCGIRLVVFNGEVEGIAGEINPCGFLETNDLVRGEELILIAAVDGGIVICFVPDAGRLWAEGS